MEEEIAKGWFASFLESTSTGINTVFGPLMRGIFNPMDALFTPFGPATYKFFAVGLFACTIAWVMFGLKKEYVNLDQPKKGVLYDLRLWTLVSMLPHMIIYWIWASGSSGAVQ